VSSAQQGTGAVSGAMGGWRSIRQPAQMEVQETVEILPFEKVEQLFYQLEPQTAFAYMPVDDIVDKTILSYTLGYWEESLGAGQDQLYPSYVISAQYTSTIEVDPLYVVTDYAYFPANPTYASPLAIIESHSDVSQNLMPGDVFTATASDASKPLNQLGYHALLDFPLGSGETYLYSWYLGSVADENLIGSGRELTYEVQKFSGAFHDTPVPQTVILVVTDVDSAHASRNTASDSVAYHVIPPVYVPVVFRNH
jgi:hypothetical protein